MGNITLFTRSLSKGGAEKQAILLYEYLSQYFTTYLIVYDNSSQEVHTTKKHENLVFLYGNPLKKIIQLYSFLKKNKITHLFNYLPINNVFGIIIGKLAGVKFLYGGIRGVAYKSKIKMFLMKFICNKISTAFVSNSFAAATSYTKYGYNGGKIKVIHNAIEEVELKRIDHPKITILSIGRFTLEKDYETAINSIKFLVNNYSEIRKEIIYKIVGYGKLEAEIFDKIKATNLTDICEITTDGIIGNSYNIADILLNTSIYEGMPNVVMEAMNHGLPVIATDAGDTNYLVNDSINGFLCPVGNAEYIAEKLNALISDIQLRARMGENSRKLIDENFRPDKVFSAYKELIENAEK